MTTNMPNLRPRSKRLPWLIAGVAVAVVLIGCASGGKPGPPATTPDPTLGAPSASAATVPATPATPTIDDGTWTVGVDIPAGTYKVGQPITSSGCYWGVMKTGSNGGDIIENDFGGKGRPSVTLKVGQDFKTSDCGTWFKVT